jgi:NAD(P)H-flavin reductase
MFTMARQAQQAKAPAVDPMRPNLYRLQRVRHETYDTFTLELEGADGRGRSFAPGQFNMVYLLGVGEVPISISGDPARPGSLVHTVRAVGTVTKPMVRMKRGDMVGVRGPFGSSWPVEEAKGHDAVIVAGGIGLAPLRPALYHILAHRDEYRRVALLYGVRTPDDLLYTDELEEWRSRFDVDVGVTVDAASGNWKGNVGVVTTLIPWARFEPEEAVAMVCGPEVMMRFTVQALQKRGMTMDNIFVSMERNMKCGIGFCGHCQFGPTFICKDGPVFRCDRMEPFLWKREI